MLTDGLAHDSGLRVLLATVARTAARHERSIEPLMSIWESHHLRVSIRVVRTVEGANQVEDSLGWRISSPTADEVGLSISAGLHPETTLDSLPMHCFLPLSHPVERSDKRVSGPLWIGPIGQSEAMASLTEERALEICGPITSEADAVGWSERDFEYERRRIARSVRHISDEAAVIDAPHLILVDDLSSWLGSGSPPSPSGMAEALRGVGHRSAVAHYGRPAFRTDAPWDVIVGAARGLQPPM